MCWKSPSNERNPFLEIRFRGKWLRNVDTCEPSRPEAFFFRVNSTPKKLYPNIYIRLETPLNSLDSVKRGHVPIFFRWNIIPIWFLPQPSYCEGHRRQAFPRRCFHLQQVHQVRRAVGVRHHQDLRGFPVGFWDQTLVPCPIYEDPLMGWVASGIWYSTYIYIYIVV